MLMERIHGDTLDSVWDGMTSAGRKSMVAQLASIEVQLLQTRFPAIRSLVDEDGAVGCRLLPPRPTSRTVHVVQGLPGRAREL
ncbi:hypothetical protein B0H10DRAFT_1239743 [Mycena sp. CBHHK59/15]|nr:hypothetical protein B0H10DRAFT_1239743 [Mycena sp. CBHHK59/15]